MRRLLPMRCLLLLLTLALGCHSPAPPRDTSYPIRGNITAVNPTSGEIVLAHEAIPSLMPAMTMAYKLRDPTVLSELHAGDRITAQLLAEQDAAGPKNLRLDQIVVIAQARPDTLPKMQFHVPAPGDKVPDFALRNQSGRIIHLSSFRGKVLALTFIYTRCPLADFCPRMSHNFAAVDAALSKDASLYAQTHLLSISFDPAYDTPQVLRSYGGSYTGRFTRENFTHWDFAAPSLADLPKLQSFFDLGVTPGDNSTLNHSLSTLVVGKNGLVLAFYPTNDWTPESLTAQIRTAAATPAPHHEMKLERSEP